MIGRRGQTRIMQDALKLKKSSFIAITGRRRVGTCLERVALFSGFVAKQKDW
jgi:hypothetical protein